MAEALLTYWFRDEPLKQSFTRWFQSGTKFDHEISKRFGHMLAQRSWTHWNPKSPKEFLAIIILLDQVPRHIYRGTSWAFKFDGLAVRFAQRYVARHLHRLSATGAMFALMPFQHSEDLRCQKTGEGFLQSLLQRTPDMSERGILEQALHHQRGHMDVIKTFGRFPKRNGPLGRVSNMAELRHLQTPGPY